MVICIYVNSVVKCVLKKSPHKLNGQAVEVEECCVKSPQDVNKSATTTEGGQPSKLIVKVEEIPTSISSDSLLYYFENRKRSGGGEIQNIDYKGAGVAIITFTEDSGILILDFT